MLNLKNITLVSLTTEDYQGVQNSLQRCLDVANFNNVVVFTDKPEKFPYAQSVIIPVMNNESVSVHTLHTIPKHSHLFADFIMVIHWDSWIVNPNKWLNEFLDHDFIGAGWLNGVVGNDGFSIKSQKLLKCLKELPIQPTIESCPADVVMCMDSWEMEGRHIKGYRTQLENKGIKYAPFDLAMKFSTEFKYEGSFGVHGRFAVADLVRQGLI